MSGEFEMSMMGELYFFLGLQIKKTPIGTLIHEQKYVKELIKIFNMTDAMEIDTQITTATQLDLYLTSASVDQKLLRRMTGSLKYHTTSRPNIVFSVRLCANFQANHKEFHLKSVKRFFQVSQRNY